MSAAQIDKPFLFYGSEVSYFTGKVRPALRYKRIAHAEILSTPEVYRDVILKRTGLGFIPVVVTPEDETWQDTSEILDALEARFPEPALYPRAAVARMAAYLIELYADEFLVLPALHYRWNYPESETKARADFAATNGDRQTADRFADRIKSAVGFVGVTPDTIPAVEAHVRDLLAFLERHFAEVPYLLGAKPSLADCALMGPMYAHLYLDAVPGKLLRAEAPRVCHWIERMNHPDPASRGEWLADGELASRLRPLLELIGSDALPILLDNVRAFEQWADTQTLAAGSEPPRGTGTHETRLRGVAMPRFTSSYTLWMVQRPLDQFRALDAAGRQQVERAFDGSGCESLLRYEPHHRLGKRHFKLVFER